MINKESSITTTSLTNSTPSFKKNPTQLGPNDSQITREELRNILKAADKEGFDKIIEEYTKEISNPDNIIETNQYLREAQEANDLPKNVKLAQPQKGFCIKSEKYAIKRPGVRHKVYINICSFEGVKPPSEDPNHRGMWSLPHLLNKSRNDQDSKGNLCYTFDVIFNPLAIKMGKDNFSFKKFICDTSINGINNNLLKAAQEKISNDYVLKTKYDYKGKEVAYVNIHSLNQGEFDNRAESNEDYKTTVQKEIDELKNKQTPDEEEDGKVFDKPDVNVEQSHQDIENLEKANKFPIIPKYKFKYSDTFEMHKFFYQPNVSSDDAQYKRLIIDIEVPLMDNLNLAVLELDNRKLKLKYKEIYDMNIDLPVDVDKDKSDAKFDRKKSILSISANIIRRNKEVLKLKEDENIEIVNDDDEEDEKLKKSKKAEEVVKKEELVDNKDKNDKHENNIEEKVENQNENKSKPKNELLEFDNKKPDPILEKIEKGESDALKEENLENIKKTAENPKIEEIVKIETKVDEDDVANQENQNITTQTDSTSNLMSKYISNPPQELIKISYLNFNCDLIYEID